MFSTFRNTTLAAIVAALALLAAPSICHASVILTYTGNDFTGFIAPYTATDKVTAKITLANPLGDNLIFSSITPLSARLNDGVQTLTKITPNLGIKIFDFSTDANGNITDWLVVVQSAIDFIATINSPPGDLRDQGQFSGVSGVIFNNPGSWTAATAAVPEPPAIAVLGAGLLGLGLLRWRRRGRGTR